MEGLEVGGGLRNEAASSFRTRVGDFWGGVGGRSGVLSYRSSSPALLIETATSEPKALARYREATSARARFTPLNPSGRNVTRRYFESTFMREKLTSCVCRIVSWDGARMHVQASAGAPGDQSPWRGAADDHGHRGRAGARASRCDSVRAQTRARSLLRISASSRVVTCVPIPGADTSQDIARRGKRTDTRAGSVLVSIFAWAGAQADLLSYL